MFSRKLRMELKAAELKIIELSDDVLRARDEKYSIVGEREQLLTANKQQKIEIKTLEDRVKNLQETVRSQTEADLLLNALKAIGVIPKQEKEPDSFGRALELQNRLAQCQGQSQAMGSRGISSLLGGVF